MKSTIAKNLNIFLQPGECFVGDADYKVSTLLGSCVSITLWHPARRIGAMSHFVLPRRKDTAKNLDGYYGEEAMLLMLRELVRAGLNPVECEARIFGGGNMFPGRANMSALNIGLKNGEVARALLAHYSIPVVYEDLFGIGHRRIFFNIGNGSVRSHQVGVANKPEGVISPEKSKS